MDFFLMIQRAVYLNAGSQASRKDGIYSKTTCCGAAQQALHPFWMPEPRVATDGHDRQPSVETQN
jgi:hypothetical protein